MTLAEIKIIPWQPLIRPPVPGSEIPEVPAGPLKALACRNSVVSLAMLITTDCPVFAQVRFTELALQSSKLVGVGWTSIPADALKARLVGAVPTPEAGPVMEVVEDADRISLIRASAIYVAATIPKGIAAGLYTGKVIVEVAGQEACSGDIEIEVADVDLPDAHNWDFFLNVWMNPATIARWHGVEVWSDEHFALMKPYIEDLAAHGQKTAVVPIIFQPWGTQTQDPFPNAVIWRKRGNDFEFDFSIFGRYVELHEACGIDKAIHCYSVVQGPGYWQRDIIEYTDVDSGETRREEVAIADEEYSRVWKSFFDAFRKYLTSKGWLDKVYIAFDEQPEQVMEPVMAVLAEHAPDFKIALAANSRSEKFARIEDLCLSGSFDDKGIAEVAPAERRAMGVAELLAPDNVCAISKSCPSKTITTFYVCCGPAFPNTFVFSPLVESRMLPWLAAQGGYDGFLRWSYNDWSDNPFTHPEYAPFPTGDVHFVYPGDNGPVTSLRWEQLREGIQDYELVGIAASKLRTSEDMVDFEQAISLASRNPNGNEKAVGDIEIARRLLMPIAARK